MALLLQVRRSQAGLVSAFGIIERKTLTLQSIRLIRRRIWRGIPEIRENLKYILTVSLVHNSGYTFMSCNLALPALLADLLEVPQRRQELKYPGAKSQSVLSWREGKRHEKEEGKQQKNKNPTEPGFCV